MPRRRPWAISGAAPGARPDVDPGAERLHTRPQPRDSLCGRSRRRPEPLPSLGGAVHQPRSGPGHPPVLAHKASPSSVVWYQAPSGLHRSARGRQRIAAPDHRSEVGLWIGVFAPPWCRPGPPAGLRPRGRSPPGHPSPTRRARPLEGRCEERGALVGRGVVRGARAVRGAQGVRGAWGVRRSELACGSPGTQGRPLIM